MLMQKEMTLKLYGNLTLVFPNCQMLNITA